LEVEVRSTTIIIGLFVLALIGFAPVAKGAISPVLNYQGSLTDSTGVPYPDGLHSVMFSFYGDSIGGSPLWTETQTLEVKRGLVHAYLGSITPFPVEMFENQPLYLGIRFESEPEFSPRHLIGSSVHSFLARNSQMLEGFPASHFADSATLTTAIDSHNSDSSAHHPLRVDASEVVSGRLSADRLPVLAIDSTDMVNGGISTRNLADSAVTANKIASGAIHSEHLSLSALTGDNIADGTVTGVDLADSTVTGDKIATGAINNEHLSVSALTGGNIADGTVAGVDLADSTVTGDKIATGAIHNEHLSISALTGGNIADGTITGVDVADSTITGAKIAAGQIRSAHLSTNSVTGANIVDESITGADIQNGSIGFNDIGSQQLTSYHLSDNSILGSKIQLRTISGVRIQENTITGSELADGAVGPTQLAGNAVRSEQVLDNSLTAADIGDEPGISETSSSSVTSVGVTVVNWMNLTVAAPSSGFIIVFFSAIASISNNEIAQASITTSPTTFGSYGEARISSNASSTGVNMTIAISVVIPVAAAGNVTICGNVRAAVASVGVVDFLQGRLQAIFIKTSY
jgi:uncharacterized protein YjbI with pentapeptide repeats